MANLKSKYLRFGKYVYIEVIDQLELPQHPQKPDCTLNSKNEQWDKWTLYSMGNIYAESFVIFIELV